MPNEQIYRIIYLKNIGPTGKIYGFALKSITIAPAKAVIAQIVINTMDISLLSASIIKKTT